MGERAQVFMKQTGVYLYTHWGGGEPVIEAVKRAIKKKWRWNDATYLTRIIFEEMMGDERGTETGYGISTSEHSDLNYPLIIVDTENQTVDFGDGKTKKFNEVMVL